MIILKCYKRAMKPGMQIILLLLVLLQPACAQHAAPTAHAGVAALQAGAGSFPFSDPACPHNPPVTVWYYNPCAREDLPVVFVMPGAGSSAREYRDGWAGYAVEKKFLLLAPEFCAPADCDAAHYNRGGMANESGAMPDESCWTLTAIEPIFDRAKAATGITTSRYSIFGHSAGAQFVHRLVLFKPACRLHKAIAANAGWYAMPDFRVPFPYGLAGTGVTGEALRISFSQKLVILLGGNDIDPHHPGLRITPEAMAQGATRLERGRRFFSSARDAAAAAAEPFNWELQVVSGAGHDSAAMSREALRILLTD